MSKIVVVNCETGEETIRDLTATEIAEQEAANVEAGRRMAEADAAEAKRLKDKESANKKLEDLGLTEDEIAALTS